MKIEIGKSETGKPFTVPVDVVTQTAAIVGIRGSGKRFPRRAVKKKTGKKLEGRAAHLSEGDERTLLPWPEVAKQFNQRTGQKLSRARVWQIGQAAIRKMRQAAMEGGGA